MKISKLYALCLVLALLVGVTVVPTLADSAAIDFESYTTGTIHLQDGWSSSGAAGSGCAVYDHAVVENTYGYSSFGSQSLRISNAVTSGCFGDQTFSTSLADEAGEVTASSDGNSGGARQPYFEAQWDFASTVPGSEQPGLSVTASPDRGDGARMSWVQMRDTPTGLEVNFYDYQESAHPDVCESGGNDFVLTNLVSGLDRSTPHTIKVQMFFVSGVGNDVVRVFVDGTLRHTGTSWEDYFRNCEGNPTRPVDSILFRTGGAAAPDTAGEGFLIDNLILFSGPVTQCSGTCYVDTANGNDAFSGTSEADAKKTIQAAVNQVNAGGTVWVAPGTYAENIVINKPLSLLSSGGKASTTILGSEASSALGTLVITSNTNGLKIGDNGQGFTILGIDSPSPAIEKAAVYFQGTHSNAMIRDNEIAANGDAGLMTEFAAVISGLVVDGNVFSGQTFAGPTPAGTGFASQFSLPNVPRQLVVISGGSGGGSHSNITFTNNQITGTAGGFNSGGEQGNTLVTIDAVGSTITGNTFAGTTARFATSLRARGAGADISGNSFSSTGLTPTTGHLFIQNNPPNVDHPLVNANTFDKGTYMVGATTIGVAIQPYVTAVPAGTTVYVLAGTYIEQVDINKTLNLIGAGASNTIIQAPATIPMASNPNSNIVKIAGAGVSVELSGFTVTGPGPSGCGSIGQGIFVRDGAYANIHDNKILNVRDHPLSGCQNGVAIMVGRAALGTSGSADITANVIAGYQKNGITVSNAGSFATVTNNAITGAGATTIIAQNGVQVSGGATGEVNGNTISNHSYSPGTWTSTGMLLYSADVDTYGNTMSENQVGIYHIDGSGVHEANILNVSTAGTLSPYFYGFVVDAPPPGLNPAPFEDEAVTSPAPETLFAMASTSGQDVDLLNNELSGDGTSAGIGIGAYGGFGTLDIDLTAKNNKVTNFGIGFDIYQCASGGCTTSVFSNVDINLNSITGSVDYGLLNTNAIQVDAEKNWWGSNVAATVAAEVNGDVDYTPWLCSGTDTSPAPGFQPSLITGCYQFTGFFQPIDMNIVNIARAGQTIPVKWRLLDVLGAPIGDPASFIRLVSYWVSCTGYSGNPADTIEEYTSGTSGLQYIGDGYWQFNWKTPKSYAGTCRKMYIEFQGGFKSPEVIFQFR